MRATKVPARLTLLTATRPAIISKTFELQDGQLIKNTSASVGAGRLETMELFNLEDLAELLQTLSPSQCMVHGLAPAPSMDLVTEEAWTRAGKPAHQTPRKAERFTWNDGPGELMLDYDPPDEGPPLGRGELVDAVRLACPGLQDVQMLWWSSASSNIVNSETGEVLRGVRGQRLYIIVAQAADIPRAGKALCERLWAQGLGWFAVSKAGTLLERALFDTSVWQTNRPDFAGGARCKLPLEQHRGAPVLIAGAHGIVDSAEAIPEPDAHVHEWASEHKEAARGSVAGHAEIVREAWKAERVTTLTHQLEKESGLSPEVAKLRAADIVDRALERRMLFGDWPLLVKSPEHPTQVLEMTVGAVLDDVYRYHNCLARDPLEPDYDGGRWVGKLFLVGGRPCLHSKAHGSRTFTLMRQLERIEVVQGKFTETTDKLLEVLRRSDIFDYGSEMATPSGNGQLLALNKDSLRYMAGGSTQFWRFKTLPTGGVVEQLVSPPMDVCASVLALREKRRLKPLDAVITAPLMRLNGTIISQGGYDADSRLLLDVIDAPEHVPLNPTAQDLTNAFELLWRPFEWFPFTDATDRAVLVSALLTAVQRPVLGTAPAFAFDAPRQGTGKTLLAECCAVLATGELPQAWPHISNNEEEVRKRILTTLRSGARVMLWDNIVGQFDSPALAVLLTSEVYTDRVLGVSNLATYPNRLLMLFTGNNFTPSGELPRRVLTCRLDAQSERPFTRSFAFNPTQMCLEQRPALVAAVLTLLRGYVVAGSPRVSEVGLGSFAGWDASIRQAVLWIAQGVAPAGLLGDPLDSILSKVEADPVDEAHGALMLAWRELFGAQAITARDLLQAYHGDWFTVPAEKEGARRSLAEALDEFGNGRPLTVGTIGRMLTYRRDRPVGGLKVVRSAKSREGSWLWRVMSIDDTGAGDAVEADPLQDDELDFLL